MKINNLQNLLGGLMDKLNFKFKTTFTLGFFALAFFIFGLGFGKEASAAIKYIDNSIIDGGTHAVGCTVPVANNYDSESRNCGSGASTVYNSLKTALTNATWGDIIHIRNTGANPLDETAYINTSIAGTYSSPMTVSPYDGESVMVRMSTGLTSFLMKNPNGNGHIIFDGINFSNNGIVNLPLVRLENNNGIVTIKNSNIDGVTSVSDLGTDNITVGLNLDNVLIKNVGGVFSYSTGRTNGVVNLAITSSKIIKNTSWSSVISTADSSPSNVLNLTILDSIFTGNKNSLWFADDAGTLNIQRNIFTVHDGIAPSERAINFSDVAGAYFKANPASYTIENNVFYSYRTDLTITSSAGNYLDKLVNCDGSYVPLSNTNFFMNPGFSENDIVNENFTNATFVKPSLSLVDGRVAFVGDSIMQGVGASNSNITGAWKIFSTLVPGVSEVNNDLAAWQAIGIEGGRFLIDKVMTEQKPSIVFLSVGLNEFYQSEPLSSDSNAVIANEVIKIMQKISNWGAKPIWLGIESTIGNPPDNSKTEAVNTLIAESCLINNWSCGSSLEQMKINANWKTTYYADLTNNVHPNDAGHALIAELAEYLYYTNHTIGIDYINVGAGARIYADGKFRNLETANSNAADISVTPAGGADSFNTNDKSHWLDIKNITWTDTKEWTESSIVSGLANTLHTVGDLTPNKYYNVSTDSTLGLNIEGTNCTNGICKSDSNGKIAFTYTGTYSEHTFKVEAGDNSNPTLTNNTENKFSVETTSVNLSLTTDENSTCRYSNNSATTFDNATLFTTTGETSHSSELTNLTSGDYTYYAICRDSNNNESSYTLEFEIAPEELKEEISSPIIKTTEGKEKMKSGNTVYSDEKEIKIQGEDSKIANGTIKIYKNSKLLKTVQADNRGKWSKKIKLSSDFSGYIKVKLYNEYGTLVGEKKTKVKVDKEKPEFTSFPKNQTLVTRGKTNLNFLATDNNKVTEYKIYLGGNIYKTKTNSFTIPTKTDLGLQYLRIRAYDKAGNSSFKETFVLVR